MLIFLIFGEDGIGSGIFAVLMVLVALLLLGGFFYAAFILLWPYLLGMLKTHDPHEVTQMIACIIATCLIMLASLAALAFSDDFSFKAYYLANIIGCAITWPVLSTIIASIQGYGMAFARTNFLGGIFVGGIMSLLPATLGLIGGGVVMIILSILLSIKRSISS